MNSVEKITFFMLVTNRDVFIADYAIASYQKFYVKYYDRVPFKLIVYANCFTEKVKQRHFPRWQRFKFVELFDNKERAKGTQFVAEDIIISPEGIKQKRENASENCDEIWSSELKKITTPYYATVDADFEVLDPEFIFIMLDALDRDPIAIGMSTDYTPTRENYYEPYSDRYLTLHERWNTWFCIYKKDANKCPVSHFYFEEKNEKGITIGYDSAAYFQKRLVEDFKNTFLSLNPVYQPQFIHYGAFSKNRSLNERNIQLYRTLAILSKRGFTIFEWAGRGKLILNRGVKWAARIALSRFFNVNERLKWAYNKK
jgi:hypothetical protein